MPECIQFLANLSDDELNAQIDALPPSLKMMVEDRPTDPNDCIYLERVSLYQLAAKLDSGYTDFKSVINSSPSDSVVLKTYPELSQRLDDEGLLQINDELELMDGGIAYRDHILHYHQFLRRGFTSNPNFDFLGRFAAYHAKSCKQNAFRIAIDHRRIMHRDFYSQMFENDGWFGPMFDREKIDDLNSCGLTIIERERPSYFDFTNQIQRTEFFWNANREQKLKTFETEEICDEQECRDTYWVNRYVHSERDVTRKVLRHFDGAVKTYFSLKNYRARLATHLPKEPRADKKIKLFRIDGEIDLDTWITLISMFLKGNEMVIRYFDADMYEKGFRELINGYKRIAEERASSGR